jgi:phage portal protein BeeE
MTYSNTETSAMAFVKFCLQPYLVAIEQAMTNSAVCSGPSAYVEFLVDSLLRADSATRAQVYTAALDPVTGWLRRDEVRRLENLEPEKAAA